MLAEFGLQTDDRLLTKMDSNEDAAVVRFPPGKALVQTVDILTPIVNNPYWFGQIAAANSLSDVYAMGGQPYAAMNIVCFPIDAMPKEVLRDILTGGMDKMKEAGAVLAGGHSVKDAEIKYGLSVSGIVDPERVATNRGLQPGDQLLLTKPIGAGVLSTALKADFDEDGTLEKELYRWCARLNRAGADVIEKLALTAATDITGFGLGGHLLEMARASGVAIDLWSGKVPLMERTAELAGMGLLPGGSFANKQFCGSLVGIAKQVDAIISDIMFDAQTSGGLVLAVPKSKIDRARDMLLQAGDLAEHIGEVVAWQEGRAKLEVR